MYKIIATDDFVNLLSHASIKHLPVLNNSFLSIEKIPEKEIALHDNAFMIDLLSQIRNQELE